MPLPTKKRVTGLDLRRMMILLFGRRGVGKSTLVVSEDPERTIVLSSHNGLGSISCYEAPFTNLKELFALLKDLKEDNGKRFSIVVIDEIDDVYKALMADVLRQRGFDDLSQVPRDDTASIYGSASARLDSFFQHLRSLPYSFRFTSGERVAEPRGKRAHEDPVVVSSGMSNSPRRILDKHLDGIWRLSFEEGTGRRMIRFTPFSQDRRLIECKSRLPDTAKGALPVAAVPISDGDERALSWADAITARFTTAMEGNPA